MCLCIKVVRNGLGNPSTTKSWSMSGEKWPQHTSKYRYISSDLSTGRSARSISTSTVDPPTGEYGRHHIDHRSTYGRYRHRSSIKYGDNFVVDLIDVSCGLIFILNPFNPQTKHSPGPPVSKFATNATVPLQFRLFFRLQSEIASKEIDAKQS